MLLYEREREREHLHHLVEYNKQYTWCIKIIKVVIFVNSKTLWIEDFDKTENCNSYIYSC